MYLYGIEILVESCVGFLLVSSNCTFMELKSLLIYNINNI